MANKTSTPREYLDSVVTDILPPAALKDYKLNRIGLHIVNPKDVVTLRSEDVKSPGIAGHEKSAPDRYLVRRYDKNGVFSPTYLKAFRDTSVYSQLAKIIVNSALQLYPNPLNSYGFVQETGSSAQIGVATIDLNHLKNEETNQHVESCRLDRVLASLGLPTEINCFVDFQKLVENETFVKMFSPNAIVQIGLASIFIPNAIGETDVNLRNIILLKSNNGKQYDAAVRIDADANVYLSKVIDGGKVDIDAVPKGIFSANEPMDVYLKNISSKDVGIDWDMFTGFVHLAKELTSRTRIDNAVNKAFLDNSGKLSKDAASSFLRPSPMAASYNSEAFFDFSEETIQRAASFSDNVIDAIGGRGLQTIPPFAEHISKYPNIVVEKSNSPVSLVQEDQILEP